MYRRSRSRAACHCTRGGRRGGGGGAGGGDCSAGRGGGRLGAAGGGVGGGGGRPRGRALGQDRRRLYPPPRSSRAGRSRPILPAVRPGEFQAAAALRFRRG